MRFTSFAVALAVVATPALAVDVAANPTAVAAPVVHQGDMLRDANNARLSAVDSINKDGSVGIILNGHYVTVPASTLSMANGKLVTSLSKDKLNTM